MLLHWPIIMSSVKNRSYPIYKQKPFLFFSSLLVCLQCSTLFDLFFFLKYIFIYFLLSLFGWVLRTIVAIDCAKCLSLNQEYKWYNNVLTSINTFAIVVLPIDGHKDFACICLPVSSVCVCFVHNKVYQWIVCEWHLSPIFSMSFVNGRQGQRMPTNGDRVFCTRIKKEMICIGANLFSLFPYFTCESVHRQ